MSPLNILFLLPPSRIKQSGEVSMLCRITYMKKRVQFNTGITIPVEWWNQDKQRITKKGPEADLLTAKINAVRKKVINAEHELIIGGEFYDVKDIYNVLQSKDGTGLKTLMEIYSMKLNEMKMLLQREYSQSTYDKFCYVRNNVIGFLKSRFGLNDIPLSRLTIKFLHDFEIYLKVDLNMKQVSANKVIQRLKSVVKLSVDFGWLALNPFAGYKTKKVETEILYLTIDELNLLRNYNFRQIRLSRVRDLFLFSVFTGLHYHEAFTLSEGNLLKEPDGSTWLVYKRLKTGKWIRVPLLPEAQRLLASFATLTTGEYLLPNISNQKLNSYLKEIAEIVGINKNLTHKAARKTFASTMLLSNGVPMEVVSKLLGHQSIGVTERHYAELSNQLVTTEIDKLKAILKKQDNTGL